MKKTVLFLILVLVTTAALAGCSSRPENTAPASSDNGAAPAENESGNEGSGQQTEPESGGQADVTLSVFSTVSDKPVQDVYEEIASDFEKENPGIQVNLQFPGSEYENLMKVKMAANDLPDVFDTHGWAIIRYGNYLADLSGEEWTSRLTDTIKNVVTDENGKVHAMVMIEAKDGLTYNVNVLEEYGIEPPETFDELMAAAEKLKTESNGEVTPFFFSGVDDWMIGQYFDYFATSHLISPEDNHADALLDGTFDWSNWTPIPANFLEMREKGYMNEDVLTAKYSDMPQRFAEGKVAFVMTGPSFAAEVHKINPDVKVGIMPVPSVAEGDEPNFSGGERYTMGAWKDSEHLEESKKLIAFFARPENLEKIANVTKLPPGLKEVNTDHEFSEYYEKYADIRVFPYFDRVYLPNGMWDVMCKTGAELLAGAVTPEQYSEIMKQEVERLSSR